MISFYVGITICISMSMLVLTIVNGVNMDFIVVLEYSALLSYPSLIEL